MSAPDARAPLERDLVATLAVAGYSFAVAVGFARVFSGWQFLGDLGILVVVGHGLSFAMRRARVSGWIAIPVLSAVLLWAVAITQYRSTLSAGIIPWQATWDQLGLDVSVVRDQFQTAVAPVIYDVGWATLASLAVVLVVVMADAFAFRAEARGEALVPGGVLFVFIAALSSPRLRVGSTMLLIGAGVLAVIALRTLHDRTRRVELATARRTSWAVPVALGSAAFVAVLAGYVGPRVPGADAEPLYETRGRGGGVTNVINPLVDIRSRLVNRGNVELFRVNADTEAYWRVAALPEFNGRTFTLPTSPLSRVDNTGDGGGDGRVIRQQVQILSLGGELLPAAADVRAVSPNDDIRLDRQSDSLVKTTELQPEEVYTIESQAPVVTPESLRSAGTANAPDAVFLDLPDLPAVIVDTAAEITAGATTDYDRMIALQTYFQAFDYSTEVQAGHAVRDIESFLQVKSGYCEQFSVAFAAMARTLGVPSRVAVGFTPGTLRADGWYAVLGKNAHAWPEIWFDGIGWIPFEPTPSRGIPGAQDYTGIAPAQDTSPAEQVGDPGEAQPLPATPTTIFRPPTTTIAGQRPDFQDPEANRPQAPRPATTAPADSGGFPWVPAVLLVLLVGGAAAPAVVRWWRARMIRRRSTPERVAVAWQRACRAVSRAGVVGAPSMTTTEWAEATADQIPVAARPMSSLASTLDRIEFARPDAVDLDREAAALGDECEQWASQVGRVAVDTLPATKRATRYFTDWG